MRHATTTTLPSAPRRFGRFELRPGEGVLLADGVSVALGARAFDLLVALAERPGTLIAKDERGQTAVSKPVRLILPERKFGNPLSRALIEQRKALARNATSAPLVAKALDALSIAPERFMTDVRNYLALRTVYFLVSRSKDAGEIAAAQQLLWDLALRLEEGDTPQAQAELRAVQQQLMDALAQELRA